MSDGSSVSLQQGGSCGRAKVQLLQEARFQPPVCKRWCREVEERRKRRTEVFKENRDLREDLHKNHKSEILKREPSWFSESRTMNATFTGSDPGVQIQFNKPQVRMALTRKTKFQTAIQTSVQNVELTLGGNKLVQSLSLTEPSDPSCSESQLENRRWTQKRKTRVKESISEVRCRSANIRTRSKRTSKHVHTCCTACSKSCNEKCHLKTRSRSVLQTESRIRRRRKVHPSAFRGKGQLRLSIILQKRQLNIHIHEARGLMGKSQRSCDSYVKLTVTSDIGHRIRMKTGIVSNNKNPKYDQDFVLCVSDDLPGCQDVRLLVSVFRQPVDSRCTQLIGCMSFGIASLVSSSKCVIGWFYLLGEEFGQSKHLRVTSQQSKGVTRSEEAGPTDCSEFRISKLAADLGRTPDSAPESEPNLFTTSSVGLKDSTGHSLTYSQSHSFDPPDTDQHQRTRDHSSPQQLMVSIIRGKDGFGFTICSDCPVRVQAVDPGGPAHQSGLRQGDSVLQLNGLPVETWKCVDLAQTIRSSSHIVLVVWRRLPELQSGCEEWLHPPAHCKTTGRKFLSQPVRSKYGHREGRGSGVRSSLGSLWRDKRVERDQVEVKGDQEMTEYSHSTTLKGTRVTSSNGENYIILSPVNPGEQLLQPVYHNGTETIGRLYQTHPRRAQKFLPDLRAGSSPQPFSSCTSTLSPPPTSSSAPPSNYSNYQNCTVVQSHLPCSSYGTYVTLAPKTLIFPVFVQPLDLCSPGRTLLMSEEMILHQADLLSAKVTVLIYSDLLLLTREDEAGQCNVLQSPLYLNTLQIREVLSEPLHIYILQDSQTDCCFLFSLESFSIEQKVKVSLCLQDNVQLQLVAAEAARRPQSDILHPSPTFPCSSPPPPLFLSSLSPYTSSSSPSRIITTPSHLQPPLSLLSSPNQRSPIWKERGRTDDEDERRKRSQAEERQQAEGESASETSENLGGRGFLLSSHHFNMEEENSDDEEEERCTEEVTSSFRPAGLRRSFSEGSLLQEPRSPRFLSDSTIHRLTRPVAFDLDSRSRPHPRPPSPHTLRKQLTGEGGSLQQILLLLNGTKDPRSRNLQLKLKSRSLAADVRSRMWFLRRRKNSSCFHSNSLEKALRNHRPSAAEVLSWAESLEALLSNQYGMAVFRHFLRSEFSEENLDFWLAVERLKQTRPPSKMASRAEKIYAEFISTSAVRQVNVDSSVREATSQSLRLGGHPASFQLAQDQVFGLMETDSYPRFLKSHLYVQLTNQSAARSVPVSQL